MKRHGLSQRNSARIANAAYKAIKLVRDGTLQTYPILSPDLFATHPDIVNDDLLAFIRDDARDAQF